MHQNLQLPMLAHWNVLLQLSKQMQRISYKICFVHSERLLARLESHCLQLILQVHLSNLLVFQWPMLLTTKSLEHYQVAAVSTRT